MRDFDEIGERLAFLNLTRESPQVDWPWWQGKRDFCAEIELVDI
jgi:hypothetical protein